MKKIVLVLLLGTVLVGCATPKVKAPSNDPLFKIKDRTVTEKDIFDTVVSSDVGYQLVRAEAQKILLASLVEEDETFKKAVKSKLEETKKYMGSNFALFLKTNGYENEEAYADAIVKDLVRLEFAITKAMNEDFDKLKDLRPREVRVVKVKKEQSAKALELAKAKMALVDIAKELKITTADLNGELTIVSDISKLDSNALNRLLNATQSGVILEAIESKDKTESYILEVVELDASKIKDKAIEHFLNNEPLTNDYLKNLFVKNDFKVYDQDLADRIRASYPGYLK